ncbi:MAG: EFR1 family ferrodoxin [Desulfopila sp.]
MHINRSWSIYFSPTGTSKKIADGIASTLQDGVFKSIELTRSHAEKKQFAENDLAIFAVPVYAGRVAPLAAQRLAVLQGNNTPAVVVVLYGNREYEDALVELRDIVQNAGFRPVAAAAFIGEHSFSNADMPIAERRPDSNDLGKANDFAKGILEKLASRQSSDTFEHLTVPGNVPYKEQMGPMPVTPEIDKESCVRCEECVDICPNQAITMEDTPVMDVERCIFCCACIKVCPETAIHITAAPVQGKRQWLHENYSARKEPEFYL